MASLSAVGTPLRRSKQKSRLAKEFMSKFTPRVTDVLAPTGPLWATSKLGYCCCPYYSSPRWAFHQKRLQIHLVLLSVPLLSPSINPNFTLKQAKHFFPYSTTPKALFGVKTPLQMFHSPLLINFSQHYEMLPLMLMLINLTISPTLPLLSLCTSIPYSQIFWLSSH